MSDRTRIIAFVGSDGCGKSTMARIAAEECAKRGLRARVVWSRFNNILSKPLLALTRCTGHNHREVHDSVIFGYHDFHTTAWLRYPFILLQTIDVNIAHLIKAKLVEKHADILIFERSPWDTLADIILDTGCHSIATNFWGRWITSQVRSRGPVFWVNRAKDAILCSRPELKFDKKLDEKINIYKELAVIYGWDCFENDRPLGVVAQECAEKVRQLVGLHG